MLNDWVRNVRPGSDNVAGELAAVYIQAALDACEADERAATATLQNDSVHRFKGRSIAL
jgi:hypothetical protein